MSTGSILGLPLMVYGWQCSLSGRPATDHSELYRCSVFKLDLKQSNACKHQLYPLPDVSWPERLRAPNGIFSGIFDQKSVGSSPSRDTCVLKQDT